MPNPKVCLIAGLMCLALSAVLGWFIVEPFTERAFLPPERQEFVDDAPTAIGDQDEVSPLSVADYQ